MESVLARSLIVSAFALAAGCDRLSGVQVAFEGDVDTGPVAWPAEKNDPSQLASVKVTVTPPPSKKTAYSMNAYVVVGALPTDLEKINAATPGVKAYETTGSVDATGKGTLSLDISRVPAGSHTLVVVATVMGGGNRRGVGTIPFARKPALAERASCGFKVCTRLVGYGTEIQVDKAQNLSGKPAFVKLEVISLRPPQPAAPNPVTVTLAGVPAPSTVALLPLVAPRKTSEIWSRGSIGKAFVELPLVITAGGATFEKKLEPVNARQAVWEAIAAPLRAGEGVALPGDSGKDDRRSLLFGSVIRGADEPLAELDLFAEDRQAPTSLQRQCGPYGGSTMLTVNAVSYAVTVRERRTGKTVGTRTFSGGLPACPTSILAKRGATSVGMESDAVDDKQILEWLDSFLTK